MFLKDEGTSRPYEPIYIGMAGGQTGSLSSQSISKRLYQRYIPQNHARWYTPPKQLQIVERHGNEIRRNDSTWQSHRKRLESEETSNIRLDDAECFSKLTAIGPYLTFHPLPIEEREEVPRHKLRIQVVELGLIRAANDLGFDLCNKQGLSTR